MVRQKVCVANPSGLHLRPAGKFCEKAIDYKSHITFKYRGDNVGNAKSVLSILGACVRSGDEIEIICEGADEQEALEGMVALVESGFGE